MFDILSRAVGNVFGTPLHPFARLKTFHLGRLFSEYDLLRVVPMVVYEAARWFLSGMPVLESLVFGCGSNYLSGRDKKFYAMPTLPGIGGTLINWPATLKETHLRELELEHKDLIHGPLSLQKLTMEHCGTKDTMVSIANNLRNAHTHTQDQSLVGVHERHSRFENGGKPTVCAFASFLGNSVPCPKGSLLL